MLTINKLVALATFLAIGTANSQNENAQYPLVSAGSKTAPRPNVVFILTDDQDLHMNSLDYMPLVQKHLIDQGTLYKRHYTTTAVCCPARVSIFTGKAAHNTNVTDLTPPYGQFQSLTREMRPCMLIYFQVAFQNSFAKAITRTTFPSGYSPKGTTPSTLANCSMHTRQTTMTRHSSTAGTALYVSMRHIIDCKWRPS